MAAMLAMLVLGVAAAVGAPPAVPADGHATCSATGAGGEIVTCEAWASGRSLTGLTLEPPADAHAQPQPPLFVDVQAVSYSLPPAGATPPRNATIASIVSGAANKHNISADEAVAMAVAAAKASPVSVTNSHPLPSTHRKKPLWRKFIFACSPG